LRDGLFIKHGDRNALLIKGLYLPPRHEETSIYLTTLLWLSMPDC